MARVHVTSEIGPLRAVLVHTPGRELVAVTPGSREDYLYDDIIDLELAQREHGRFVAVLERFAQVYEVRTLLTELVARPDVREFLVTRALEVVPSDVLAKQLAALSPEALVGLMVEGALEEAGPIARALNETGYALPPLPNLFFTRDVGIVIGEHSIIGSMRYGVRWTEELLVKALFRYHPCLENAGILYDGSEEKRNNYTLEGGDVHPVRPDLLLLGFSERSSPAALDHLCDLVFEHCGVKDVIVVVLPNERTAIHLDMIFTQLDRELCCIYPPHFVGPERLAVLHRRKKSKGVKEMPNFFAAMQAVDHPLEPIFCGGSDRSLQEREQWSSACNFFAVRPGVALTYARNEATLRELEHAGFKTVAAASLLTGEESLDDGGGTRAVITMDGSEQVRGGGGPRCMSLPLRRDDL
jgi:arginine deiminase